MLRVFFVASLVAIACAKWPGTAFSCSRWTYPLGADKKNSCAHHPPGQPPMDLHCYSCADCKRLCQSGGSKFGMCVKQPLHTKYVQRLPCSPIFKCVCTNQPASTGCTSCNRECQAEGLFVSGTCNKQTYTCHCKYPDSLTAAQRNVFISEHNERRTNLTRGRETTCCGKLPKASNMYRLTWDTDLELLARRMASVCSFEFGGPQDDTPNQGVNVVGYNSLIGLVKVAKQAISWWWSKKENFHVDSPGNMEVGQNIDIAGTSYHFTQMAWASVARFACAVGSCNQAKKTVVACVYEKSIFQHRDDKLYALGKPCSACVAIDGSIQQCKPPYTYLCSLP